MWLSQSSRYAWLWAVAAYAQSSIPTPSITGAVTALSGSSLITGASELSVPTGSYISYSTTIDLASSSSSTNTGALGSMSMGMSSMAAGNGSTTSTTTDSRTILTGTNRGTSTGSSVTGSLNGTFPNATAISNSSISSTAATSASTSAQPTNTQPCNNYAEFCNRNYSNITMVSAHNSPFIIKGNAASNQALDVITQLNDGIRMVQVQALYVNGSIHMCHSSCDLLDAGLLTTWFSTIAGWVKTHPYDVITILIGNADYVDVGNFSGPVIDSGLEPFAYIPPKIPMSLNDWPTLASMLLSGKRVVIMMDYQANQTQIPYILDEFSQWWETPFDPTNDSFPCTVQRPPGLSHADSQNRIYMTNHNLNTEISLLGNSILVPTITLLNQTNNVTGPGSLGVGVQTCFDDIGRPPNFLNVDYYNVGDGSVFEVAAKWNNVTYNRICCGKVTGGAMGPTARDIIGRAWIATAVVVVLTSWLLSG